MSTTVAFATCRDHPDLTADDRLVVGPLRDRGIEVVPLVWDAGSRAPLIVLRSCWDYHLKSDAFGAWIERCEEAGALLCNPPRVLRWNMNKRYLLELAHEGVSLPPTVWLPRGAAIDIATLRDPLGGDAIVLKPAVSLNGEDTHLVDARTERAGHLLAELLSRGDVVAQQFVEEIRTEGEVSLVFFDGVFSHAIRKRPRAGEFRVQVEHGGTRHQESPARSIVEQAEHVLAIAGAPLLYARVDGVVVRGTLVLMELEAVDPMLFLAHDEAAPGRFADAIARRLEWTLAR